MPAGLPQAPPTGPYQDPGVLPRGNVTLSVHVECRGCQGVSESGCESALWFICEILQQVVCTNCVYICTCRHGYSVEKELYARFYLTLHNYLCICVCTYVCLYVCI